MRIAITGATGYIGAQLCCYLKEGHEIIPLTRMGNKSFPQFNLSQPSSIRSLLRYLDVDYIIHTAAIARRQQCRDNPKAAHIINVEATKIIAEWASQHNVHLIFLSTIGIHEDNIYANTKLLAERTIRATCKFSTILRLAYTFGFSPSHSRPKPLRQLEYEARRQGSVHFDCSWHFQPTSIEHICHVTRAIVENNLPPQEVNIVTTEVTTMFEIASNCLPHQIHACRNLKYRLENYIPTTHLTKSGLPTCSISSLLTEVREMFIPIYYHSIN